MDKTRARKRRNNKAGKALLKWWTSPDDMPLEPWTAIYRPVKNWRLCRALPLNVIQAGLRARIRRMSLRDVIVAQRLKRFASIMNKLQREPNMELTQMQDLGGCRAILPDVASENTIAVKGFQNRKEASESIDEMELSKRTDLDAVLVWVNSIKNLRAAYPNYYADPTAFLEALNVALK
jgi:hypothetical protein